MLDLQLTKLRVGSTQTGRRSTGGGSAGSGCDRGRTPIDSLAESGQDVPPSRVPTSTSSTPCLSVAVAATAKLIC